jgi:hypothetical protein
MNDIQKDIAKRHQFKQSQELKIFHQLHSLRTPLFMVEFNFKLLSEQIEKFKRLNQS